MHITKQTYKRLFFVIGCLLVVFFWYWSSLLLVSIGLFVVIDSFTIKMLASFTKKRVTATLYKILRYVYGVFVFIFLVTLLRTFVVDVYYVPSSSMEQTLFPGDYVLVDKLSYGTKVPNYFGDIPVVGSLLHPSYIPVQHNRFTTLKAFKNLERNDIVVFNAPQKNKKLLFIKRLIGLPGDTLTIKNTTVIINGKSVSETQNVSYRYMDHRGLLHIYANQEFDTLPTAIKNTWTKVIYGDIFTSETIFPNQKKGEWTIDNYGEIIIPKKGMTIQLTKENIAIYEACIRDFENKEIVLSDESAITYTFTQNYYFMLGDNRHNSIDSRMYGFIPENYIQGKMLTVLLRK